MSKSSTVLPSAIEVIGQTPLVELKRITSDLDGRIFAKLEYLNPGFSKKDRAARQIIEDAEDSGALKPGQTVVELTSGNMGTGLAIVCGIKGYPFIAVMSRGNSVERARMMEALGAEVIMVDQAEGSVSGQVSGEDLALVEQMTNQIVHERQAFRADQFQLRGNFRAHYLHTAQEILSQTAGEVDAFCDFVGSAGTLGGCTAAFKEYNPEIRCYGVEPEGAAILSGGELNNPSHRIQGGGYLMDDLSALKDIQLDGYLQVSDAVAIEASRRLAKEEGIFAGFSSGANLAGALELLQGPMKGKNIAIVICDSGLKYLSTDLWE